MTSTRWYQSDRFGKWVAGVLIVALLILAPSIVTDAIDDPSPWNLTTVVVLIFVFASMCLRFVRPGRSVPWRANIDPSTVPEADVHAALAAEPTRIRAIKNLRQQHPGLGLADAVHLVDAADPQSRD